MIPQDRHLFVISAILFILISPRVRAQLNQAEWTERYVSIVTECQHIQSCIEAKALEFYPDEAEEACDTRMLRTALLLTNRNLDDPIFEYASNSLTLCDTNFSILRYNLGLAHYTQGNYSSAERQFIQGANLLAKPDQLEYLSAAGAAAFAANELERAATHFRAAYLADSLNPSPTLLNNLSGICNQLERPEEAIQWAKLALEVMQNLDPKFAIVLTEGSMEDLAYINLFSAALQLEKLELANQYYMQFDLMQSNMPMHQKVILLNAYIRLSGKTKLWQLYENQILAETTNPQSDSFEQLRSAGDPALYLLTGAAKRHYAEGELETVWKSISVLFQPSLKRAREREATTVASSTNESLLRNPGIWWGLSVVFLFLIVRFSFHLRANKTNNLSRGKQRLILLEALRSGQFNPETKAELSRMLAPETSSDSTSAPTVNAIRLSRSQAIVLRAGFDGEFPKDTAATHNWSPTYVYQLRSELRRKLGIPLSLSFEQWYRNNQHSGDVILNAPNTDENEPYSRN